MVSGFSLRRSMRSATTQNCADKPSLPMKY